MRIARLSAVFLLLCTLVFAQQKSAPQPRTDKKNENASQTKTETPPESPETSASRAAVGPSVEALAKDAADGKIVKWDMREVAPIQTHHEIKSASGKVLRYTATAGRLPIKDAVGNIEAEMFFVAYTLDGTDASRRPVTFAFNGGPGSASIWLHMGALGPRKVVLENEGWMPAAPYRLMDNAYTPLDQTDLVLIDAIGTGFSRPADMDKGKKFWGLKGDIEGFGEFIRMYLTRYERWSSPLYLLGESYGTTRAAGISGYLIDKGIAFNGITLLSTILDFESVLTGSRNDEAYILTLPTYTMIAWYQKKLAAELMGDQNKTRAEAEAWASGEYAAALAKGDNLSQADREAVAERLARYTGLKKEFVDQANLRIDVRAFTSNLLLDQKLRVGRLDGRYSAPNPIATLDESFFDPSSAATTPPFTSVFNDYVRRELGYKVDMPYYVSMRDLTGGRGGGFNWSWGDEMGYADTVTPLRAAMVKNPHMKVQVMEGFYDLATPYYAVNYSMNHLDLAPQYHKNISFVTYDSGHMVYLHTPSLEKMHSDFTGFVTSTVPK